MHELSITQNIVAIVSEHARGATVTRVTLRIGALSGVLPEAIRFCFEVVAQGTVLEGARLEIEEVPGRGRCRPCGQEVPLTPLGGRCGCGSSDVMRMSGDELTIAEMVTA